MTARKPTEQKRRQGNPGHQKLPAPSKVVALAPLADTLDVPEHFGPQAERLWRLAAEHASAWLAPSDEPTLRLACEAMDRRAELIARLQSDGYVLYTDKGYAYQHPAAGMLSNLEQQITKWLSLLGLTSIDRSKLGVAEVKAQSALERIATARAQRGTA